MAVFYFIVGLLMCITFVGIPFGVQLFKFGAYSLWPFGHELVDRPGQPGCLSTVMNLIWILLKFSNKLHRRTFRNSALLSGVFLMQVYPSIVQ